MQTTTYGPILLPCRVFGLALLLAVARPASAADASEPTASLTAGDASDTAVGAIFERDSSGALSLRCSGVLLAPDVVLTAARCLSGPEPADAIDAGRFVFVLSARPFPLVHHAAYVGRKVRVSPGFELRRLKAAPLFMRAPEGENEQNAMEAIEARCGKRDANLLGQKEWLRCLTEQSPDLQRAVGVRDRESGEDDIALLFLKPRPRSDGKGLPPYESRQCTATLGEAPRDADDAKAWPKDRDALLLVGFGASADADAHGLLRVLFRPIERHQQAVKVQQVGTLEFQLSDGAITCDADAGAGIFVRRKGAAPRLVGLLSRRDAQETECGPHALATNLTSYRPWIEATLRAGCLRGERATVACPTQSTNNEARPKRKAKG